MQLHELRKVYGSRKKIRVGRGGKRGTTSGRGQKGQKSRAGHRIRPAQRDLILRLPKRRGFRNKPKTSKPAVFNLSDLSAALKTHIEDSKPLEVTQTVLKEANLLPHNYRGRVKILGEGQINFPIVVKGLEISRGAKIKIEKAGGIVRPNDNRIEAND